MRDEVGVIVPAYNEAHQIAKTVFDLKTQFSVIIVVDDGSADKTSDEARKAGAVVIRHIANMGQGGALQTGFRFALEQTHLSYIATFDADGQHRVTDLAQMHDYLTQNPETEVVIGSRFLTEKSITMIPSRRRLILRLGTWVSRSIHNIKITDTHNGLRIFKRQALSRFELKLFGMDHASEILEELSKKQIAFAEFPVEIAYSEYSQSKGQSSLNAFRILYNFFVHRNI